MFNKFELVVDGIMRLAAPQVEVQQEQIVEASSSSQLTDAGPEWPLDLHVGSCPAGSFVDSPMHWGIYHLLPDDSPKIVPVTSRSIDISLDFRSGATNLSSLQ